MTTSAVTSDPKVALGPCRPASDNPAAGFGVPVLGAVTPVDAFNPCIEVQGEHNISTHPRTADRSREKEEVGWRERGERKRGGEGNDLFRELDVDLCQEFGGVSAHGSLDLSMQNRNITFPIRWSINLST